jgi:hypothetical protein
MATTASSITPLKTKGMVKVHKHKKVHTIWSKGKGGIGVDASANNIR